MADGRFAKSAAVVTCITLAGLVIGTAQAADRMVLAEEFTATTCGYCYYSGQAMEQLMEDYPDDLVVIDIHMASPYRLSWCGTRFNFYGFDGTPSIIFDGDSSRRHVGIPSYNIQEIYNWYYPSFNARRNTPTDMIIDLYADEDESTPGHFYVTADITIEAGGTSRETKAHFVQLHHGIPNGAQYGYCVRNHAAQTVRVDPGETTRVTQEFTMSNSSPFYDITNIDDAAFVVFCRVPNAYPDCIVDQTALIHYPFPGVPAELTGDLDDDGDVDLADLQLLLAAYGSITGDPNYKAFADLDNNGTINLSDLQILLSNYGATA